MTCQSITTAVGHTPARWLSAHPKLKDIGDVQDLLDNHEAAANSLHTADGRNPQPPCASLQTQANSSPALTFY